MEDAKLAELVSAADVAHAKNLELLILVNNAPLDSGALERVQREIKWLKARNESYAADDRLKDYLLSIEP